MIIYPVCITKQIGALAQLHVNSYGYGHDTLCWYKGRDMSRTFHVQLPCADIIISGFKESAEYTFYTMNSKNQVRSSEHTAYFNCDSPCDHINKLKGYVSVYEDPEYANNLMGRIGTALEQQEAFVSTNSSIGAEQYAVMPATKDMVTPVEILQQEWEAVADPQDYEYAVFAKIYQVLERYYTLKCIAINKDHDIDFDIDGMFSPVLKPGYQITRFDVYTRKNDIWCKERMIPADRDEINVGYDFATVYKIKAYAGSELTYEFIHYQPDETMYSYLWNTSSQKIEDTINADISLDHDNIDMTPTEVAWYNASAKLGAADWIAIRPQFSNVANYVLYFYIPSYSLLMAIGKKFYLAAQETDLAFGIDYQCLVEITGEYVGVNYADCYLGGDVYFYIVDENMNPVSKVTRFSFEDDLSDYNEKVRQLETRNYQQRLEDIMQVRFPKAVSEISAYCGILASTSSGYTECLWRSMIARMNMTQGDWISRPKVFFGIIEEYLGNFTLDRNFFLDDVTFYHATSIFTFPRIKDKDYVLAMCSFNKYNNNVEENYYPSFNTSIEIQTTEYDYTIMYAIDKNNYRRSGFIIACRENNYVTIYNKDLSVFNDNRLYIKGRG